ncbi:uncharacterized protein [Musca autumnalis]|uniref:uncharacterized protein n=1 Tax=Musca autumnalis TaxID=221902 RepID=UPI003CF07E63
MILKLTNAKWITLALLLIFTVEIYSKPIYDIYDDLSYYSDVTTRRPREQPKTVLSTLKTGYYYIDNGSITPVRRTDDPYGGYSHYTPIVRYRKQQTQRKKLFVPNFYG